MNPEEVEDAAMAGATIMGCGAYVAIVGAFGLFGGGWGALVGAGVGVLALWFVVEVSYRILKETL